MTLLKPPPSAGHVQMHMRCRCTCAAALVWVSWWGTRCHGCLAALVWGDRGGRGRPRDVAVLSDTESDQGDDRGARPATGAGGGAAQSETGQGDAKLKTAYAKWLLNTPLRSHGGAKDLQQLQKTVAECCQDPASHVRE